MPGGLMQLVADSDMNLALSRNIAVETFMVEMDLNGAEYHKELGMSADTVTPKHLIFKVHNPDLSMEEFKAAIRNSIFQIIIGSSTVYEYHLSLLAELEGVRKINDDFVLNLPDYFIQEIRLIALHLSQIRTILKNIDTSLFDKVSIVREDTFLDTVERRAMCDNPHEDFIQTMSAQEITCDNPTVTTDTRLDFDFCVKGYFIESKNLDALSNLELSFNGHRRFAYNQTMLTLIGHRISDTVLYLPFVNSCTYKDTSRTSYIGSCNHSRIDNVSLSTRFNNLSNSITFKLHALHFNILKYANHQGVLRYNSHNAAYIMPAPIPPSQIIYKVLDQTVQCPITCEDIGREYGVCVTCSHSFDYNALTEWVTLHRTCPMCRGSWGANIKYKNELEPDTAFYN